MLPPNLQYTHHFFQENAPVFGEFDLQVSSIRAVMINCGDVLLQRHRQAW